MRIAFLGDYNSFDYYHIGGTDAVARRLAFELRRLGVEVDFIHFNSPFENIVDAPNEITLRYFIKFKKGLKYLSQNVDHVVTIHIPKHLKSSWMKFRLTENKKLTFHLFYFGRPENLLRRTIGYLEAMTVPYNGTIFCVSPDLKRDVSKWAKRSFMLYPPVSETYFIEENDKPNNIKLNVSYIGRIDPGKGADIAFRLFRYGSRHFKQFNFKMNGFPWEHKPSNMKLHKTLLEQDDVIYEETFFETYSPTVNNNIRKSLKETDVLFLPYAKLSSTIDTPLLLLEGMAHLCVILTRPLGSMEEIYGTGEFMPDNFNDPNRFIKTLSQIQDRLLHERKRIYQQNKKLQYDSQSIAHRFYHEITM